MSGEMTSGDDLDDALGVFDEQRRRLFGIAYRMLGSVADAEDIVQETWIRWQSTERSGIREPGAFLATITTRLSITVLQSARVRRETYVGPWLPEPVNTEDDPALGAERAEALQFAVLLMLEKLTPTERAAYVLREAFDYPYPRIAEVISVSVVSARQLVSRARAHLTSERRIAVESSAQRTLLAAFLVAAQEGDAAQLEKLFADEVVSYTDGNGVALAARIPVSGRGRVAKFVAAFAHHFWVGKSIGWVRVNDQPAATLVENGIVTTMVTVTTSDDGIRQLLWVMSPEKLRHVSAAHA
ncbi:RNA polymerase sigma-70 factor [Microbacterium saperdae]|uniref:RNA polymerase sigma-70 factor (ECF subfamily) n=1 Tax=Microbacterium saperdae TaxID=69368 RepID=A0A543BCC1_9MICO|nr:RNA polymerase sigma-70 factor [Microbacterium saperdae]TQL82500.1 RNA polymerase sigma-70 factor (ECF subfamily) [Microbacterium saperdae]GGM40369.1 RNA polymerase sigma24 factor [Microbacterium saperdae]